jgi:hypothetical protein
VFLAKAAAIASALSVAIVALNIFTGFWFPFVRLPQEGLAAAFHSFAGYWLAMAAAGAFVCCGMLALQGLAAQLLPYRYFLRVSSFLQLAAFFAILSAWFLRPPGAVPWLPSSWFFGLEQELSGRAPFHPLAPRALGALAGVSGVAAITFGLAYGRSIRKIIEQPDILPAGRPRRSPRLIHAILRRPIDRAIVLFTARTIARSRQHRLFLAAYAGIGLAVAFAYARDLLYGPSEAYERQLGTHWDQLNVPLLMGGLVLLCFAVVGTRAIFSLPIELRANWVFWLTAVQAPSAYFRALRKALFAVTVLPVWLAGAAAYFLIWPDSLRLLVSPGQIEHACEACNLRRAVDSGRQFLRPDRILHHALPTALRGLLLRFVGGRRLGRAPLEQVREFALQLDPVRGTPAGRHRGPGSA